MQDLVEIKEKNKIRFHLQTIDISIVLLLNSHKFSILRGKFWCYLQILLILLNVSLATLYMQEISNTIYKL